MWSCQVERILIIPFITGYLQVRAERIAIRENCKEDIALFLFFLFV